MKRLGSGRTLASAAAVFAMAALPARGDLDLIASGEAQLGWRGVWGDTDSAKFEQYRDVQEGAFGSVHLLVEDRDQAYYLRGWLDDIAEKDQQYRVEGGRYGLWGIRGFYSEFPNVSSNQAVTPYFDSGNFACTVGPACDGVSGISGPWLQLVPGFDRTLAPGDPAYAAQIVALSAPTPLRYGVREGDGEIFYRPTANWDLSTGYRVLERNGNRPLALGFGSPGGNYSNVAAPIDERTHEARADFQYAQEKWNLGLGYLGSFFENDLDFFQADNPLTSLLNETTASAAVGRHALSPNNSAHLLSFTGAVELPTDVPARLAASFAWGLHLQNDSFLPVTSNEAINTTGDPRLGLARDSLDGKVQTINGHFMLTARPRADLNVEAFYRIYDYDNDTNEIILSGEAPNDRNLRDGTTNIAYSYRRHTAGAEASWRPADSSVTTTLGFGWELWQRDPAREVEDLNEYAPSARIDWQAAKWARIRATYEFAARRGSDYNALPGALAGLRKYSQADRLQHRFDLLTHFDPRDDVGVTFTSAFSLSDFDDSAQGLTDDNHFNLGIDTSYRPHPRLGLWANYAFDYINAFQKQGGGTWTSKTVDMGHNAGVGADFVIVPDLLDFELSYFLQLADSKSEGGGTAVDFPTIEDTLQAVTAGFSIYPLSFLTIRPIYRWEKYDRNNFHENFPITDAQGDLYLQNRIADYNAHILSLSAIVSF